MQSKWVLLIALGLGCNADSEGPADASPQTEPDEVLQTVIEDPQTGDPGLSSADSLFFAPAGHLVIGDGANDRLVIVATGDLDPDETADDWNRIANLPAKLADAMGATETDVRIEDVAVNPRSGRTYIAASRVDTAFAGIFTVEPDSSVALLDLATHEWVAVAYPEVQGVGSVVTDVSSTEHWIVAAVTEATWTPSQVITVPLPVTHGDSVSVTSTHTYHRSHRQWETLAPITTLFTLTDDDGVDWVGASYQCAPVVRFTIEELAAGNAETVGTTPYDYGGGRQVNDFVVVGEGEDTEVLASVVNLGGTRAERSLFLAKGAGTLDEDSPVVFNPDRSPAHDKVQSAPKLELADAHPRLDDQRLVRLIDGVLEIVDIPD